MLISGWSWSWWSSSSYRFQCSLLFCFELLAIARDYGYGPERNSFYVFQFVFSSDICVIYASHIGQNMFNMERYASANMAENNPKTPNGCMISDILAKICSVCKYMCQLRIAYGPKYVQYGEICVS